MSRYLHLVSSMAVGWIPYYERLEEMPPCHYRSYAAEHRRKRLGCDLLFYSGNTPPSNDIFASRESLRTFIKTKNYRGIFSLREVKIHIPDSEKPYLTFESDCSRMEEIGYTPFRLPLLRSKRVLKYSRGRGNKAEPTVLSNHDGAYLSHEIQFRIGRIGNLGAKLLTKYWAPYVWMRVEYDVRRDGSYTLKISGSYVPTQIRFIGAQGGDPINLVCKRETGDPSHISVNEAPLLLHYHDMVTNDPTQIKSVLESREKRARGNYYTEVFSDGQAGPSLLNF